MRKLLLIPIVLILGLVAGNSHSAAALTVAAYDFTPKSGGPGAVVHLTGEELYSKDPLTIWLVRPLETAGPGGMITRSQPLMKLGVTRPDPGGGHPQATFVIPGRLPDGSPITERQLGIMLTAADNDPSPELDIQPFEFVPVSLPATGERATALWLILLCAGSFVILGVLAVRRKPGPRLPQEEDA